MKINLSLFILTLSAFTGSFVSAADINSLVGTFGVQNRAADRDAINAINRNALGVTNFNGADAVNARAASSMVRAQLTANGDTTLSGIGTSDNFSTLYPFYTADVARLLKVIYDPNSTVAQRDEAIKLVDVSQWLGWISQSNNAATTGNIKADINGAVNAGGQRALTHAKAGFPQHVANLTDLGAID
jgi:hypothetical protein